MQCAEMGQMQRERRERGCRGEEKHMHQWIHDTLWRCIFSLTSAGSKHVFPSELEVHLQKYSQSPHESEDVLFKPVLFKRLHGMCWRDTTSLCLWVKTTPDAQCWLPIREKTHMLRKDQLKAEKEIIQRGKRTIISISVYAKLKCVKVLWSDRNDMEMRNWRKL